MSRKPPPAAPCRNCDHQQPHNLWGRCAEAGCDCRAADFPAADNPTPVEKKARKQAAAKAPKGESKVLVFRNPHNERPVAVPDEVVAEADRVYRAFLLNRAGYSWVEIARDEQWPTAAAVAAEVSRYKAEGRAIIEKETGRQMLVDEIDRLNALQTAVWPAAMEGKVQAAMAARTFIMDRVKIYEIAVESGAGVDAAPTTVIVLGGSEDEYVAGLQAVAGGDPALPPPPGNPGPDPDQDTPHDG